LIETGATLFGAEIRNLFLVVDSIFALVLVDFLALDFLAITNAFIVANGRAGLKSSLLLAESLLF